MNQLAHLYPSQYRRETRDINKLLRQLSRKAKRISEKKLLDLLKQPNFFLVEIRRDGHIVAMATLTVKKTFMGKSGEIDDVVVDRKYRGRGLGEEIMRRAIQLADSMDLDHADLTSRSRRKAANALYKKVGFKPQNKKRNFYRLNLS